MDALLFKHEGYEVITAAWTAAAMPANKVEICYQWGADRLSWFTSATGIRRVILDCTMTEFVEVMAHGHFAPVDCRIWQKPEVSRTPYYSPGELVLVRHRHGERAFWAYYAPFDLIQEPVWRRPRRFLWWKWEDWYWQHELSPVVPHQFRSRP